MKENILTVVALSLIILNACKKDEKENVNTDNVPKITINDPKQFIYEVSDTAYVNVIISDNKELHEAKCWFITRPQNDTLWTIKRHSHSNTIEFDSYYVIGQLSEEQNVDFIVTAENEAGKTATAKHSFEVHNH